MIKFIEMPDGSFNITEKDKKYILDRLFFLQCLEEAGVDNWQGMDYAGELYWNEKNKEE
jgi:hypothetical protein